MKRILHLFFIQMMPLVKSSEQAGRLRNVGFTMVELVVTIGIIGVLAVIAAPRLIGRSTFESRGFHDEAVAVVRYAQKTAIAWRRSVFVCVTATEVRAGTAGGCATTLSHPTTGGLLVASAPSGVALSPTGDFSFDGIGRPSTSMMIAFSSGIPGDPARQIVVEAETGYVHP